MDRDVVIVGAGPVGLWLATELRLAGVAVTVLEQRTERDPNSKALTIHPRTLEVLASRGFADAALAEGVRIPSGHFAALDSRLDFRVLDTPYPFTLALPQARTEELLEERARGAGADVRRGVQVAGLSERAGSVRVRVDAGPDIEAAWVVGCDGVRSTVRSAAGIDFPGSPSTVWGWLGDVLLAEPPDAPVFSRWSVDGQLMGVPLPGGIHRLVGISPDDVRTDWPGELTLDELRRKVAAIAGTDWGMHSPTWLSRFGNAARQAQRYRKDRILLAGDAAHQHMPAGGVGMNVGIQDAMNLGWKLGATVRGAAPVGLLDTYHDERHPVGADLLRSTMAQTALMSGFTPDGRELRALLADLIVEQPQLSHTLAERLAGLSVRYPAPHGAHPLVGTRVPDLPLAGGDGALTALRSGRHVVLDLGAGAAGFDATGFDATGFDAAPVVEVASAEGRPAWSEAGVALVRPDGHVAWADADAAGLPAALAGVVGAPQ